MSVDTIDSENIKPTGRADVSDTGTPIAKDTQKDGKAQGKGPKKPRKVKRQAQSPTARSDAGDQARSEDRTLDPVRAEVQSDASDDDGLVALIEAITGRPIEELTLEEIMLLEMMIRRGARGNNIPTVVIADEEDGTTLPPGVDAAYVPEENVIILRPGLTPEQRRAALREEFGEFLAHQAQQAGIEVGPGDAGARVRGTLEGEAPDQADYVDRPSDGGEVTFEGETVAAEFSTDTVDIRSQRPAETAFLLSLDTNGDEVLTVDELVAGGINRDQAERLVRLYGMPTETGEFVIPTGDSEFDGVGIDALIGDRVDYGGGDHDGVNAGYVIRVSPDGDGVPRATIVLSNASDEIIAHALIRYVGYLRFQSATPEQKEQGVAAFIRGVYVYGMTAKELDWATDAVLGDTKPFDGKNGHRDALFSDFKGPHPKTNLRLNNLLDMFETKAITVNRDPNQTGASFIGFSVHRGHRPIIRDSEDFGEYAINFDADGNGVLDYNEFRAALHSYYGAENVPEDVSLSLFNTYSSYSPETGRGLAFSDLVAIWDEEAFSIAPTGTLTFNVNNLSARRITKALFSRVAEKHGLPEGEITSATGDELSEASVAVFGVPLNFNAPGIANFGQINIHQTVYYSPATIVQALTYGAIFIDGNGQLRVRESALPVTVDEPEGVTPETPYTLSQHDNPGSASYGNGFTRGNHHVSRGQVHLGEEAGPLGRTTIYIPSLAYEPSDGGTRVMNPLEYGFRSLTSWEIRQVRGSDMTRVDNGDGSTTWKIRNVTVTVATGGEEDEYLSDYQEFSSPSIRPPVTKNASGQVVQHRNLERSHNYVDQDGNVVEIWVPRGNQFRTDANGNSIPIESSPVVVVNGDVVETSHMYIGLSRVDGTPIMGFTYTDASGQKKTTFVTIGELDEEQTRALVVLAGEFEEDGYITNTDDVYFDETHPAHAALIQSETTRAEAMSLDIPEDEMGDGEEIPPGVAEDTVEMQDDAYEHTVETGVAMDADAAVAIGLITEEEADPDLIYFVPKSPELQRRMTAVGMGNMDDDVVHTVPLSHQGRTLNAWELVDNHGNVPVGGGITDIPVPFRADYFYPEEQIGGGRTGQTRMRIEFRPKFATAPISANTSPFGATLQGGVYNITGSEARVLAKASGRIRGAGTIRFSRTRLIKTPIPGAPGRYTVVEHQMVLDGEVSEAYGIEFVYELWATVTEDPSAIKKLDIKTFKGRVVNITLKYQRLVQVPITQFMPPWAAWIPTVLGAGTPPGFEYGVATGATYTYNPEDQEHSIQPFADIGIVNGLTSSGVATSAGMGWPLYLSEVVWSGVGTFLSSGLRSRLGFNRGSTFRLVGGYIIDTLIFAALRHPANAFTSFFITGGEQRPSGRYSTTAVFTKDPETGELVQVGVVQRDHGVDPNSTDDDNSILTFSEESSDLDDDTYLYGSDGQLLRTDGGGAVTVGYIKEKSRSGTIHANDNGEPPSVAVRGGVIRPSASNSVVQTLPPVEANPNEPGDGGDFVLAVSSNPSQDGAVNQAGTVISVSGGDESGRVRSGDVVEISASGEVTVSSDESDENPDGPEIRPVNSDDGRVGSANSDDSSVVQDGGLWVVEVETEPGEPKTILRASGSHPGVIEVVEDGVVTKRVEGTVRSYANGRVEIIPEDGAEPVIVARVSHTEIIITDPIPPADSDGTSTPRISDGNPLPIFSSDDESEDDSEDAVLAPGDEAPRAPDGGPSLDQGGWKFRTDAQIYAWTWLTPNWLFTWGKIKPGETDTTTPETTPQDDDPQFTTAG